MKCTYGDFQKLRQFLKERCEPYTPTPSFEFRTEKLFLMGLLTGICIEPRKITVILDGNVIEIKVLTDKTSTYVTSK